MTQEDQQGTTDYFSTLLLGTFFIYTYFLFTPHDTFLSFLSIIYLLVYL